MPKQTDAVVRGVHQNILDMVRNNEAEFRSAVQPGAPLVVKAFAAVDKARKQYLDAIVSGYKEDYPNWMYQPLNNQFLIAMKKAKDKPSGDNLVSPKDRHQKLMANKYWTTKVPSNQILS